jgi:Mg2+ and Co2+ transporter CorA
MTKDDFFKETINDIEDALDKMAEFRRDSFDAFLASKETIMSIYDTIFNNIDALKSLAETDADYNVISNLLNDIKDSVKILAIKEDLHSESSLK